MLKKNKLTLYHFTPTLFLRFISVISFISFLIFFPCSGCRKYSDPNARFYKYLGLPDKSKPLELEKRRVNLDKNHALEILLVYKSNKGAPWKMAILKKKLGSNDYKKIFEETISHKEDLLDRLLVKDFFKEGFNSISLEFSTYEAGREKGLKKFIVYRLPSTIKARGTLGQMAQRAIFFDTVEYDASSKASEESPIKWIDTNEDGQLEIVTSKKENNEKEKEYAYSKLNLYKGAKIYKFNGVEFMNFSLDKPFLFYKDIVVPGILKPGDKGEIIYRVVNLGIYSPKSYLSFSFPMKNRVRVLSLKNLARRYGKGSSIFHLRKKTYIRAKYPLVEYSIFPWPKRRIYTFRLEISVPENTKNDTVEILHRASLEYRGRSIFVPDPNSDVKTGSLIPRQKDQQGFPSYPTRIRIAR